MKQAEGGVNTVVRGRYGLVGLWGNWRGSCSPASDSPASRQMARTMHFAEVIGMLFDVAKSVRGIIDVFREGESLCKGTRQ